MSGRQFGVDQQHQVGGVEARYDQASSQIIVTFKAHSAAGRSCHPIFVGLGFTGGKDRKTVQIPGTRRYLDDANNLSEFVAKVVAPGRAAIDMRGWPPVDVVMVGVVLVDDATRAESAPVFARNLSIREAEDAMRDLLADDDDEAAGGQKGKKKSKDGKAKASGTTEVQSQRQPEPPKSSGPAAPAAAPPSLVGGLLGFDVDFGSELLTVACTNAQGSPSVVLDCSPTEATFEPVTIPLLERIASDLLYVSAADGSVASTPCASVLGILIANSVTSARQAVPGAPMTRAVVAVPAWALSGEPAAKAALEALAGAFRAAGLEHNLPLPRPIAAAKSLALHRLGRAAKILVVSLGEQSLEVDVVLASESGSLSLAGSAHRPGVGARRLFDPYIAARLMYEHVRETGEDPECEPFQDPATQARRVLCGGAEAVAVDVKGRERKITAAQVLEDCSDALGPVKMAVGDVILADTSAAVTDVVLCGTSGTLLRSTIASLVPAEATVHRGAEPRHAHVLGSLAHASDLARIAAEKKQKQQQQQQQQQAPVAAAPAVKRRPLMSLVNLDPCHNLNELPEYFHFLIARRGRELTPAVFKTLLGDGSSLFQRDLEGRPVFHHLISPRSEENARHVPAYLKVIRETVADSDWRDLWRHDTLLKLDSFRSAIEFGGLEAVRGMFSADPPVAILQHYLDKGLFSNKEARKEKLALMKEYVEAQQRKQK